MSIEADRDGRDPLRLGSKSEVRREGRSAGPAFLVVEGNGLHGDYYGVVAIAKTRECDERLTQFALL
jgi:hypothetical protein